MRKPLTYLRKVGVKVPALPEELLNLLTVRNCIAHANGELENITGPEKVRRAIKALPGFRVDSEGSIGIDEGAVEPLADIADRWFSDVLRAAGFYDWAGSGKE